jgi:outer membrane protein assembly factor BamB
MLTAGGKGGLVTALDKRTGKQLWRSAGLADEPQFASLVAADIRGVRQVIAVTDESLSGVDAAEGRVLWRVLRKAHVKVAVAPIVRGDYVFAVSGSSIGCDLFRIDRAGDGAFAAARIYSNRSLLSQHGGIAMVGGLAYGHSDGKGWVCLDATNGEIRWREKEALGQGGLTYADGRCYLRDAKSGEVMLIEASDAGWNECGRFTPGGLSGRPYWAYLAVANGRLYVRDQGLLTAYDVKGR